MFVVLNRISRLTKELIVIEVAHGMLQIWSKITDVFCSHRIAPFIMEEFGAGLLNLTFYTYVPHE